MLQAEERLALRTELEAGSSSRRAESEQANESRKQLKETRTSIATAKVQQALAARAPVKEAHAAMLAETAGLMATYAPTPEPIEDPKAKKGKK